MPAIRFRLLKVGEPGEKPDIIFPIREKNGSLLFHEGGFTEELATKKPLEALTVEDLPQWLLKQGLPLTLDGIEEVEAPTGGEAFHRMIEATGAAYQRG